MSRQTDWTDPLITTCHRAPPTTEPCWWQQDLERSLNIFPSIYVSYVVLWLVNSIGEHKLWTEDKYLEAYRNIETTLQNSWFKPSPTAIRLKKVILIFITRPMWQKVPEQPDGGSFVNNTKLYINEKTRSAGGNIPCLSSDKPLCVTSDSRHRPTADDRRSREPQFHHLIRSPIISSDTHQHKRIGYQFGPAVLLGTLWFIANLIHTLDPNNTYGVANANELQQPCQPW